MNTVIETINGPRSVALLIGTEESCPREALYKLRALCRSLDLLAESDVATDIIASVAATAARLASELLQQADGNLTSAQERVLAKVAQQVHGTRGGVSE